MTGGSRRIVVTAVEHAVDAPSGSAKIAWDCASFLANGGHEVWVVAPTLAECAPEQERVDGVMLLRYRVRAFPPLDPRRVHFHQECTKTVLRRFVCGPVDAVYGHAPLQYQGACELYGGGTRKLYTVHSPVKQEMEQSWTGSGLGRWVWSWLGGSRLNRIERECLANSDRVTVLSDFTRKMLCENHGDTLDSRIVTVPGWVDLDRFVPVENREKAKSMMGWRTDVPVFFTLRRLVPRMGMGRLLRAARILVEQGFNFQLVIGGTGPLADALRRESDELGLQRTVSFAGRVSDRDLPLMYAACDAFVLPTAALECFGLIALEALACGRPVLATPVGAIPEVLSRFERRWIASSPTDVALGELMGEFLRGGLPVHSAEELRGTVQRYYDRELLLSEVCRLVLN